jgi:hypothetical protein
MAKLKTDPITQADLVEYLASYSDFSFEVGVLKMLDGLGFSCDHGGSYTDTATRKTREFDIRATKAFSNRYLRLAVECKNVRENSPLLISCLPRRPEEAFHDIVVSADPEKFSLEPTPKVYSRATLVESKTVRLTGKRSIYKVGEPVGKSCDQVGRAATGDLIAGDSDIYDRWSQALASANDLTYESTRDGMERTGDVSIALVFALLVVPNTRLWAVQFDETGNQTSLPTQTDRCSYFTDKGYSHSGSSGQSISHLEFVTLDGLTSFIDNLCGTDGRIDETYPIEYVLQKIRKIE